MSSPSCEVAPAWREEIFQDACRIWSEARPSVKALAAAFIRDPGLSAAFLHRLAARLRRNRHHWLSILVVRVNLALHGCLIHPESQLGPGLRLPHPSGLVVGRGVRSGRDVTLFQNVTLGARRLNTEDYPILGDGVLVYPNSIVLGSIRLGSGCIVGAGSIVLRDVADGETVVGAPAAPVRRRPGVAEVK